MSILNRTVAGLVFLQKPNAKTLGLRFLHGLRPEVARTLEDKLAQIENVQKDPALHFRVNIGLPKPRISRSTELKERLNLRRSLRENKELAKSMRLMSYKVPLDKVHSEWQKTAGQFQLRNIAEHFGIFDDLFGEAYFVPRIPLNIKYEIDAETVTSVYSGNQIKPREAAKAPNVNFEAEPGTFWSLVLTNPDGHFTEKNAEYLHWFIGNIPGNDISKGDLVMDYMQPFPARGTGFHRLIFVLYKQEGKIDFSEYSKPSPCVSLSDRTFRTPDFYRKHQDAITPAGLAFFQSDWDSSLTDFFHNTLDMKEPVFEYDFPAPYFKPQRWFPKKESFNTYLDNYRDPKQIAKEHLLKRLKKVDPFKAPEKEPKFPHAFPEDTSLPSWLRVELRKERLKWGRYSSD